MGVINLLVNLTPKVNGPTLMLMIMWRLKITACMKDNHHSEVFLCMSITHTYERDCLFKVREKCVFCFGC